MENKQNRTWAIVGTVAAILLCGCPGLLFCLSGAWTATGKMPDFLNGYGTFPGWLGFAFLCVAIVFIAIAIVVPVLTLRKKKDATTEPAPVDVQPPLPPQEPLPPAS